MRPRSNTLSWVLLALGFAADRLGGDGGDVGSSFDHELMKTGLERQNARDGIGACGRPHGGAARICGVFRLDGATAAAPFNAGFPAELIKTKPERCHLMRRTACRKPLSNAQGAPPVAAPRALTWGGGRPLGS